MSAMAGLRSATWPSHQRLEKRLDVKARFSTLDAYRAHLEQMWGFCAGMERPLDPEAFGGALPDFESRRKLPLLTRDLVALGTGLSSVTALACCPPLPTPLDPAAAFGCAYVLEGATLGGRVLLPLVEDRLHLTIAHGATFLGSYGDEVPAMWQTFSAALDGWCGSPERQAHAVQAAVATFDALADWLCGPQSDSVPRKQQ
jgi:heme oxygenase